LMLACARSLSREPEHDIVMRQRATRPANGAMKRASNGSGAKAATAKQTMVPLTISRRELLSGGRDRQFRHLVHSLFSFAAHHERIRSGHARVIGLAGIEYTVLIAIAHLAQDGDVNVKTVADHLYLSGAFITSVTKKLLRLGLIHKKTD